VRSRFPSRTGNGYRLADFADKPMDFSESTGKGQLDQDSHEKNGLVQEAKPTLLLDEVDVYLNEAEDLRGHEPARMSMLN
jgi:hypothetical protein